MSSDFLTSAVPYVAILVLSDIGFFYAAFLSLSVWRGLSVPIYKSRALWTGILALVIGVAAPVSGNVSLLSPPGYYDIGLILVYEILYPAAIIGLFVWIDRTVNTLIRLDYLRRDVARWTKFRWAYWMLFGIQFVLYFAYVNQFATAGFAGQVLSDVYGITLTVPAVYGSVVLLVGSRRTTNLTFRLHARWIGYTIAAIVLIAIVDSLTTNVVLGSAPFLLISYCFYKLAKFLVPVGKLQAPI